MLKTRIGDAEFHRNRLEAILGASFTPFALTTRVTAFAIDHVAIELTGTAGKRRKLSGPALFSAADITACFAMWNYQSDIRSLFTTNMTWTCYSPVVGEVFAIEARLLGTTRNLATLELTVAVVEPRRRNVATALATVYLRGFEHLEFDDA